MRTCMKSCQLFQCKKASLFLRPNAPCTCIGASQHRRSHPGLAQRIDARFFIGDKSGDNRVPSRDCEALANSELTLT